MNLITRVSALISMVALGLTLTACNDVSGVPSGSCSDSHAANKDLKSELQALSISLDEAKESLALLKKEHNKLKFSIFLDKKPTEWFFNAKEAPRFQTIQTSEGLLFVSIVSAQPYLDGYKVSFCFGNPSNATFCGVKFKLRWNRPMPSFEGDDFDEKFSNWERSYKDKLFDLGDQKLVSGYWNQVEVFLSPCSIEELELIELSSIESSSVLLNTPKN